jgi:hypothetical protein
VDTPVKSGTYETTPAYTAGKKKGTDIIKAQDDDATIGVYSKAGKKVTTVTVDCTPPNPKSLPVIATVNVT